MEDSKIQVNVPENYDGKPITVVLREGDAESVKSRSWLNTTVALLSIGAYVRGRKFPDTVQENPGIIVYSLNPNKPRLEFIEDPTNSEGASLSSQLNVNPDLTDFQINKDRFFGQKELEKLIRKNAHCFSSLDDAKKLITSLQNFQVKYIQTVERADDRQGNTKNLQETAIEQNKGAIPTTWKLNLPLYVATKAVDVEVSVEIEKLPNNMPGFGFYSMDLELLLRQVAEDTIMAEVNELQKQFVCLEKE